MTCRRIHIVGRKNSGKTTLVCELVTEFTRRGLSVATIKHTHHTHELDTPGKDSWKHRTAGAAAVGVLSAGLTAVYFPNEASDGDKYSRLDATMGQFDIVLVEGDLHATAPRLEVWRASTGHPAYASSEKGIRYLITDDELPDAPCDLLPRASVEQIADAISELLRPASGH